MVNLVDDTEEICDDQDWGHEWPETGAVPHDPAVPDQIPPHVRPTTSPLVNPLQHAPTVYINTNLDPEVDMNGNPCHHAELRHRLHTYC